MRIVDILRKKGGRVVTAPPGLTVHQAMQTMVAHGIGAVVIEDDGVQGILTERDILQFASRRPDDLDRIRVEQLMSRNLVVAVPEDPLDYVMDVLTNNRIRHLPIMDGDRLVGIVSIGDVVDALRSGAEAENRYMHQYIRGVIA